MKIVILSFLFLGAVLKASDSPREEKKVVKLPIVTLGDDLSQSSGKEFVQFRISVSDKCNSSGEEEQSDSASSGEHTSLTSIERLGEGPTNSEERNKLYEDRVDRDLIATETIVAMLREIFKIESECEAINDSNDFNGE